MVDVQFKDNSKIVLDSEASALARSLYYIGVTAQGDIIDYMSKVDFTGRDIVDTGRLRGSISFMTPDMESGPNDSNATADDALKGRSPENAVLIGSAVNYAQPVNNGAEFKSGRKVAPRKFMENGINPNLKKYSAFVKRIYEGKE